MFWSPVLPGYSPAHALGSSLYFFGFYLLAAFGMVCAYRFKSLITLCASSVLMFTLTSVITIVDYDQRYRLPAELFLVPLVGVAVAWLLKCALKQRPEQSVPLEGSSWQPLA
jgi:hypothetical protein